MSGILYIVATPLGNSQDITLRALETLKSVDIILCEDTRVTSKLLAVFGIEKSLMSFHEHTDERKMMDIIKLLEEGKKMALVTDAGTPGISDPGNKLVERVKEKGTNSKEQIVIVPVPGASAVTTALSISGFPTDKFLFLGFPPHKNKRQKFFKEVAASEYTVVFYESSHRIKKCIQELVEFVGGDREVCICRELTKKFESIYRGKISAIANMDIPDKGEFVVVVRN